jgi:hypothetical protein
MFSGFYSSAYKRSNNILGVIGHAPARRSTVNDTHNALLNRVTAIGANA